MEEVIQYVPNLYATFWALIPPLVAIILALITKEVYSSVLKNQFFIYLKMVL